MPMGHINLDIKEPLLAHDIEKRLVSIGKLIPREKTLNDGPADRFKFQGAKGEIGFIRPMSNHFCHLCNRLRLTANGRLRVCLLSDREIDIKGPMRAGCTDDELAKILVKAVQTKPKEHELAVKNPDIVESRMSGIGG